jgi:hypothetical protein
MTGLPLENTVGRCARHLGTASAPNANSSLSSRLSPPRRELPHGAGYAGIDFRGEIQHADEAGGRLLAFVVMIAEVDAGLAGHTSMHFSQKPVGSTQVLLSFTLEAIIESRSTSNS